MTKAQQIVAKRKRGWTYADIAESLNTTEAYVYRCLKQAQLVTARKKKRKKRKT